jgi:Ser/Thr protein kinase RdoA (MazF antagonist)
VAVVSRTGEILSIGDAVEFFDLVEEVTDKQGTPYAEDLFRIARERALREADLRRCDALVNYLARLHAQKKANPILYTRHIRDLVGHGEMLMGVIDTYPDVRLLDFTNPKEIEQIEVKAVEWRNRIKFLSHRLSRIHGDFHPFGNIRFRKDNSVMALDLAREEYGEPADDLSCLSINYIFFSVWHYGEFVDPFKTLFNRFIEGYVKATNDQEMLRVIPPFFAFRGLVVTHPHYYPDMERERRRLMLNFILNVMNAEKFEANNINEYLTRNP